MLDTQVLREKILLLAVQGKLVVQDSSEGSAEELYEKINNDRYKFIGKNFGRGRILPISSEEIPFDIPSSWKWMRIPEMSFFQEGPGILAKDFRDSGIPLIRISGMQTDRVELTGCNYLDPDMVASKWSHFKLDLGDILISTSASMDKFCEVYENAVGAIPYTGQIRFKMYGGISKEYFKWFVRSSVYAKQIESMEAGAAIKHYGPTHLKKMIIPIPPVAEQMRIVDKIEQIFALLDLIDENMEAYGQEQVKLNEKILEAAIQGELVEHREEEGTAEDLYNQIQKQKKELVTNRLIKKENATEPILVDEIPFNIPNTWKWVRLSEVLYLTSGKVYKNAGADIPYFKVGSMNMEGNEYYLMNTDEFVSKNELGLVPPYTIVFPKRGGAIATNKKRITKHTSALDPNLMGATLILTEMLPYFWFWLMTIDLGNLQNGSAVPQVNNKDIYPLVFPLPPLGEQERIVAKLNELLPLCNSLIK